jgi:lipoprotein-anchoring transpeptidase ErfK/SrfK
MSIPQLSRRDFLKLSASGVLGLVLSELGIHRALAAPPASQGRAIWSGVRIFDAPSITANIAHLLRIDETVDLLGEVEGDYLENKFNNTWYQVDGGYTFSGWVQPVETRYQKPVYDIPPEGRLAEVTVPYSLTHLAPNHHAKKGHRIFYETTYWIKRAIVNREEKSVWYETYDKVFDKTFYLPSYNIHLIPDEELTPLSPEVPDEEKLIHVDLETQMVTAFEGEKIVLSVRCGSGGRGTETPKGEWRTYHKGPSVHMTDYDDAGVNLYSLPGVPWVAFFTGAGHAFHGTYWHNDYGISRSNGCVNLPSSISKWLYRWTSPVVPPTVDYLHLPGQGTRVVIE